MRILKCNRDRRQRTGKVLTLFAIALPMLFGILGLVVDGSLLMAEYRRLQQVADAAATAGAREIWLGNSNAAATNAAVAFVKQHNGLADADVIVGIPPVTGPYAGNSRYVQVAVARTMDTYFIQIVRDPTSQRVSATAVAGSEISTAGGAVVVLDPDPSPISLTFAPPTMPVLPAAHLGGLEVLGVGRLRVHGAVFVDTIWGGVDQNGDPAGNDAGPPWGISCTPLIPLTKLLASDIRVVGGVDDQGNYGSVQAGQSNPLQANKLPVSDPLRELPSPTVAVDPTHVVDIARGTADIVSLPLLAPPVVLQPGVYEWIQVTAGTVIFQPGIYVIRNVHPLTGIALNILAGQVTANGVMFYITDTTDYSPTTGFPDSSDGESVAPPLTESTVPPSVSINAALPGTNFSPIQDPTSPFHGILIYQRRLLRRPIVIAAQQLLGGPALSGIIYAKWGRLVFAGNGTYDTRFVTGTATIVSVLDCTILPSALFPPAEDVFLVE